MIRFRCFSYAVNNRTGISSCNGINHYPVFLSHTESTDGLLCRIVIQWNFSIFKEYSKITFLIDRIGKAIMGFSFRRYFALILLVLYSHSFSLPVQGNKLCCFGYCGLVFFSYHFDGCWEALTTVSCYFVNQLDTAWRFILNEVTSAASPCGPKQYQILLKEFWDDIRWNWCCQR